MSGHRNEDTAASITGQSGLAPNGSALDRATDGWILLVGNETARIDEHRRILGQAGHVCWTAASAGNALSLLEQYANFVIVISDFALPDMDGPAFGSTLRRRFADKPWLQLVFLADQVSLENALSALHVGATDLLEIRPGSETLLQAATRAKSRAAEWRGADTIGEQQIQSLKKDADRLAKRLHTFASGAMTNADTGDDANRDRQSGATSGPAAPVLQRPASKELTANLLRSVIHARAQRNPILSTNRFVAPVWDMLLDLTLAEVEGRMTSVSSLCIASGLPQSTALRRIKELKKSGIIILTPDETDGRREFVKLTDHAMQQMTEWLDVVLSLGNATFASVKPTLQTATQD